MQIATEELKTLILSRVEYHSKKFEFLEKKGVELKEGLEGFEDEAENIGKFSSRGPADGIADKAKKHRDQATCFKFMASHLIPNETYVLDESDLRRIEVL